MRFRLRTLLIALALGPPVLAGSLYLFSQWFAWWFWHDLNWR
jgi:hypothetical protein